jgi:hypothetical protein
MPKLTAEQLAERRRRRVESEARWQAYLATQPIDTGGTGGVMVKLTRELPMTDQAAGYPYFVGELDGTPIRYHCLYVSNVVAIRRGLEQRGAVWHNAHDAWLELATAAELEPDPLSRLHDAVLTGRAGGAMDGAL